MSKDTSGSVFKLSVRGKEKLKPLPSRIAVRIEFSDAGAKPNRDLFLKYIQAARRAFSCNITWLPEKDVEEKIHADRQAKPIHRTSEHAYYLIISGERDGPLNDKPLFAMRQIIQTSGALREDGNKPMYVALSVEKVTKMPGIGPS